jgi:NADH-quinone oxidoreductase subunit E
MQDDRAMRRLGAAVAVGLAVLVLLAWPGGFRLWPALACAVILAALAALLMRILGDADDDDVPAAKGPAEAYAPKKVMAEPMTLDAEPPAPRAPRARKGADSMPRPAPASARPRPPAVAAAPVEKDVEAPAVPPVRAARPPLRAPRVRKAADSLPRPAPRPNSAPPDDLKVIRGIGPGIERQLNALGVTRFAQIAAWTQADIDRIEGGFGFPGRIGRDAWVAQARALAGAAGGGDA